MDDRAAEAAKASAARVTASSHASSESGIASTETAAASRLTWASAVAVALPMATSTAARDGPAMR